MDSTGAIVDCILQARAATWGCRCPTTRARASRHRPGPERRAAPRGARRCRQRAIRDFVERYRHHFLAREDDHAAVRRRARDARGAARDAATRLAVATGKSRRGPRPRARGDRACARSSTRTRCADETIPKPHPAMLHRADGRARTARPRAHADDRRHHARPGDGASRRRRQRWRSPTARTREAGLRACAPLGVLCIGAAS